MHMFSHPCTQIFRYKPYNAVQTARVKPDSLDYERRTPLFSSAKFNMERTAEMLIAHGACINHRDLNRVTPLHIASGSGACELVKLLLEKDAELEARDLAGMTPLHYCARYRQDST
jgi:ankyrin repeat protein